MKSISTIIGSKIAKKLDKMSLSAITCRLRWLVGFVITSMIIISPQSMGHLAIKFTQAANGGYYRVFVLGLAIIYRREIWRALKGLKNLFLDVPKMVTDENTEIVKFLEEGTINRQKIIDSLGYSRDEADDLLDELDDLGITERGTNNSRVLKPSLSTSEIAELLEYGKNNIKVSHGESPVSHTPPPCSDFSSAFTRKRINGLC